ncbi:hypothetical protein B296_00020750, partial [Ensete ventricosum]
EQPGNKDGNEDWSTNSRGVATGNATSDQLTVTSVADDTKNAELPVINEALEKDAVESPGNIASDAGNNGPEEEEMVS